jgi:hypothetical protein
MENCVQVKVMPSPSLQRKVCLLLLTTLFAPGIASADNCSSHQRLDSTTAGAEGAISQIEFQQTKDQVQSLNRLTTSLLKRGRNAAATEANKEALTICQELKLPVDDTLLLDVKNLSKALELKSEQTLNHYSKNEQQKAEVSTSMDSSTTFESKTLTWKRTEPNCSEKIIDGIVVKTIISANSEVHVALIDTGRRYRAEVAVKNVGKKPFDIRPKDFKAVLTGKDKPYELKNEDAAKLAKGMVRDTKILASLIAGVAGSTQQLCAAMQTTQSTVYSSAFGSGFYSGTNGFGSGTFSSSGISTISTPNTAARIRADQDARQLNADAASVGEMAEVVGERIVRDSLKANTIDIEKDIGGTVFFERRGYGRTVTLTLPIGIETFQFSFGVDNPSSIAKTLWYGPEKMRGLKPVDLVAGKSARSF